MWSGSPALRQRKSHKAMSIAACANARDRADSRSVGQKQEVAPDALDLLGTAPDEGRTEGPLDELHHRRPAGADRVAIAGAGGAVGIRHRDDRRFLADEALDRVGALHLRLEVDHERVDTNDAGHGRPASTLWTEKPDGPLHGAREMHLERRFRRVRVALLAGARISRCSCMVRITSGAES